MTKSPDRLIKTTVNLPASLCDDLDEAVKAIGHDQTEIIRACISLALPNILALPGLVPALNLRMLKDNR